MVTSLFRYERITTTKSKALEVRKTAEKLITRSKVDTVHNRRQAATLIWDKLILAKLFKNIGPRMKERAGGYTRVLKVGQRLNDAADVVLLELVDYTLPDPADKSKDGKAKRDAAKKPAVKKANEKKVVPRKTTAKSNTSRATTTQVKPRTTPRAKPDGA
jgi:large subunit ribosomal protein L17